MLLVAEPILGEEEKAALIDVVESGWITMGERVRAFERAFADMQGVDDAAAVSSCTAGLHLALQALGIGPGDDVLVPSLTFVATANAVRYTGATPVFVDVEGLDAPLMSPSDAAARCTERTRAVIIMHFAGYLCDRASWRAFAAERGLLLIEDAAHAAGVEGAGTFGDAAAFSFFGNKNMTTAEGGMVFARDEAVLDRIRQLRCHGMTTNSQQRLIGRTMTYDVTMLGNNYRMDEFRAAIGLVQLGKLRGWNDTRAALTRTYRRLLKRDCPGVAVPFSGERPSAHHIMPVLLPAGTDRARLMERMRENGVQTTIHYPPAHQLSLYRDAGASLDLPVTEEFARRTLTLPLHPRMTDADVETVTGTLAASLDETLDIEQRQGEMTS